jgi:hypothetical protein
MRHPIWRRTACLLLVFVWSGGFVLSLSACTPGGTGGALQGTSTVTPQGTVNGLVVAGPTCPVERADQPCPPKPVPDRLVVIETAGGAVVARVTTDQNGQFTATLPPGTYDLKVPPGSSLYPVQRTKSKVTVIAGQTVQVQVMLDSGIR